MRDVRGPVVRRIETTQTFLTASKVGRLVGDYLAGAGIEELADRSGIHRAMVFAHLRRRNTPRRTTGLDVREEAEAVRLYRDGVSMRAIARRMGVGRKVVRTAVLRAGVVVGR